MRAMFRKCDSVAYQFISVISADQFLLIWWEVGFVFPYLPTCHFLRGGRVNYSKHFGKKQMGMNDEKSMSGEEHCGPLALAEKPVLCLHYW